MRTTIIFVILDEEKLEIAQHEGEAARFKTAQEADFWAADRLNLWTIIKVHFTAHGIHHEPNL